jgi:hypothetical protein
MHVTILILQLYHKRYNTSSSSQLTSDKHSAKMRMPHFQKREHFFSEIKLDLIAAAVGLIIVARLRGADSNLG